MNYIDYNKNKIELDDLKLLELYQQLTPIDNEYLQFTYKDFMIFLDNPEYHNQSILKQLSKSIMPDIIICHNNSLISYIIAKNQELIEYYNLDRFIINHQQNFLNIEK